MSGTKRLAFLAAALFLVLFTGTVGKPGLPPTLKADEPAYFLMAESLVHDGDLRAEDRDYRRLMESYPYLPTSNLILMSDDGWQTVYFGKPFIYPLLGAPFVAVFGANGLVVLNALLFLAMIWLGAGYLERFNPTALALVFSAAFFFLSPTFSYVFWLQPEILNAASVAVAYAILLGRPQNSPPSFWRILASAAVLAVGAYNKPVLLAFGLPLAALLFRREGLRGAWNWCAAAAVTLGLLAGGSFLLTGHPSSYLGVSRGGVNVTSPEQVAHDLSELSAKLEAGSTTANSWSWVFRKPPTTLREIGQSTKYFFIGRHTGLVVYFPFAVISFTLFLLHWRRRPEGWLTLLAIGVIAAFFICVIPLNWHGGGGFIGNRYFLMVYPAFLFLVSTIRPAWLIAPGAAWAGLFLGVILFTPFGAPVPEPTLQAHTRSRPFQFFPLEITLRKRVPGYSVFGYSHLALIGRKDLFLPDRKIGGAPLIHTGQRIEVVVMTDRPITGLFFEVMSFTPDNEVRLELAGDSETVVFEGAGRRRQRRQVVELNPVDPPREHLELENLFYIYDMEVEAANGRRIHVPKDSAKTYYAGARLEFLGRRDQLGRSEHYRAEWLGEELPQRIEAGEPFAMTVRLRNDSKSAFDSSGPLPVTLRYRWRRPDGEALGVEHRQRFPEPVEPGTATALEVQVAPPPGAGVYRLELDLAREHVGHFSEVASEKRVLEIRVSAPTADSPAP